MKKKMSNKEKKIIAITLAVWGLIYTGTGIYLNKPKEIKTLQRKTEIIPHKVAHIKSNEIVLKDIELEYKANLSVNVKDYLNNVENLNQETLDALTLDTSMVKNDEPGYYTYTITCEKKTYNGRIKIKEK